MEISFASPGAVTNAAFAFSITDTVPQNTPAPSTTLVEKSAMFITVSFVGDFAGTTFSSESAFQASPKVKVLVTRSLDIDKLQDGCPDVSLYFFNESTSPWVTIDKPTRDSTLDNAQYCGYTLETDHWSKFAVGGVKIAANVLQSIIPPLGGGGSAGRVTALSPALGPGTNVNTSVATPGGPVNVNFASVLSGGSISVSQSQFSQMSRLFSQVSGNTATLSIAGDGDKVTPYMTTGNLLDVDASSIKFTGPVQVSIPYDPSLIPQFSSESEVRFLHHTDAGWEDVNARVDANANTVTANLTSLSPVVPAVINDGTYDESYFARNPLGKMSITGANYDATLGGSPAFAGERQIGLAATVKNLERTSQNYTMVFEVLDADGYTLWLGWQSGMLERGAQTTVATSTIVPQGDYNAAFFVWDNVSSRPLPLSSAVLQKMQVP